MRLLIGLADRQIDSPSILTDLISNLNSRAFRPDEEHLVIIGVCPLGLREFQNIPVSEMASAIDAACNIPASTSFVVVPREELKCLQ